VLYFTAEEEDQLRQIQREVGSTLSKHKRLGLVAASRAIWETLTNPQH
jgi:hypothetical protein